MRIDEDDRRDGSSRECGRTGALARAHRFYAFLLLLYPASFRADYGLEMRRAFGYSLNLLQRRNGRWGLLQACWKAACDTLRQAICLRLQEADQRWRPKPRGVAMDILSQDLRLGLRGLRRSPGFTLVVVCTLALGIGANTAVFSAVNAVLLRPLPYEQPESLVRIWGTWSQPENRQSNLTDHDFVELRRHSRLLERVATVSGSALPRHIGGEDGRSAERITSLTVSVELLPMLGVDPILGRHMRADDRQETLLLSYEFWQRRFAGDPEIVGKSIVMHGRPRNVIGVLPPGFRLHTQRLTHTSVDAYRKFSDGIWDEPNRRWLRNQVMGRLKPGVALPQLQEELDALTARLLEENPRRAARGFSMKAQLLHDEIAGDKAPVLWTLLGAVALVLLIACANVGSLLLVRAQSRTREFAIRSALGGSRRRIVRHFLAEAGLLGAAGAVGGLLVASVASAWLIVQSPQSLPRLEEASFDSQVLGFSLAATLFSVLIFGLVPALQASRTDLSVSLGERSPSLGKGQQRLRRTLIVGELALSLVLLAGAGLLLRSFYELHQVPLGFQPGNVLTFSVSLPSASYSSAQGIGSFYQRLESRVASLPGVESVGSAWPRSLGKGGFGGPYSRHRNDSTGEARPVAWYQMVTPGYFDAVGTRLQSGRSFRPTDGREEIIIDESLAAKLWPGQDALGKGLAVAFWGGSQAGTWARIIGVVEAVPHSGLTEEAPDSIYLPWKPWAWGDQEMTVHVRSQGDPLALAAPIRGVLGEMDPNVPMSDVEALQTHLERARAPQRFVLILVGAFAAVGLALASVGLYGLVSFGVSRRTRELGIRIVYGAKAGQIFRLVLGGGLALAGAGIGLGLIGALILSRWMESLLFKVAPTDPLTLAAISMLLLGVVLLACWHPARRASKVDPVEAIRTE